MDVKMNKAVDLWNWASLGVILGSIMGFLPPLAALVGATYYLILIWESETLRAWRLHRRLRHVAKLEARLQYLKHPMAAPPEPIEELPDTESSGS